MQYAERNLSPLEPTPETINQFRQNNPELIIRDAKQYLGLSDEQAEGLRKILLARGVNKWLKVRRDLVAYKKQVKHKVKAIHAARMAAKAAGNFHQAAGMLHAEREMQAVRAALCKMCKTDRYVVWPESCSRKTLRLMNTIRCSDEEPTNAV